MLVALIGWLGDGLSFGSGYGITAKVVSGELSVPWHAPVTRYLATMISYFSGIPGGIFAPSLAVGAALGASTSNVLGLAADTIPITALCMAGFLAAVTQSPITVAIIVMEMIDGHGMVISLMAVGLIANAVSARISPELYQQLALGFMPEHKSRTLRKTEPIVDQQDEVAKEHAAARPSTKNKSSGELSALPFWIRYLRLRLSNGRFPTGGGRDCMVRAALCADGNSMIIRVAARFSQIKFTFPRIDVKMLP